jgi:hypothetical protein
VAVCLRPDGPHSALAPDAPGPCVWQDVSSEAALLLGGTHNLTWPQLSGCLLAPCQARASCSAQLAAWWARAEAPGRPGVLGPWQQLRPCSLLVAGGSQQMLQG